MRNETPVTQAKTILEKMKDAEGAGEGTFLELQSCMKMLKREQVNDNFEGTIKEIDAFVDERKNSASNEEHIHFHRQNISRWIEELTMLNDEKSGVTIDYSQRGGREI
ncbi:YtzH-like family protein [Alteribacter natronophilus]|uniref:YtzH-like family protein n=1 Tax=Alteribacter natronophilus TaxID=2583810 RepID=UPI00110DA041|nr:YtzH-like family protein [Alteribacter natronophilus]TMW71771.1 hypothetical protein FGB90_12160 [Alteribacter natronophilus]